MGSIMADSTISHVDEPVPVKVERRRFVECPACRMLSAHRTHRVGLWDHMASLVGIYPYGCAECDTRFSKFRGIHWKLKLPYWTSCPHCGSIEITRISKNHVPPTLFNAPCRWLSVPSYRCPECRTKFFSILRPKNKTPKQS
jgi:DNA-directed RNA polymerase subunit RPC12/RpoP